MPLRSASAILLKLKSGDHVLLHMTSTCHTRGDLPRKETVKGVRIFRILSKEKEDRKIKLRRKERTIHDVDNGQYCDIENPEWSRH